MTGRPRYRAWLVLVASLAWAGCGNGPDSLSVQGSWSGTWQYTASGLTVTDQVTATLNQRDGQATGTWQAESGASGQLSFNTMGTTSGTLTINQATLGGASCNATTTFQGSITPTRIELTVADIPPSGVCQWGTNSRFELDKS